jgi:HSP20 family protein
MKLITRNFVPNNYMPSLFDSLFRDDFFKPVTKSDYSCAASFNNIPAANIKNEEDKYIVELAVPGYDKSDFSVELDKGLLTISAKKLNEKEEDDVNYYIRQFSANEFKRTFRLPENTVNAEAVSAEYEAGVLKLTVPKKETEDTKLKIEVL